MLKKAHCKLKTINKKKRKTRANSIQSETRQIERLSFSPKILKVSQDTMFGSK